MTLPNNPLLVELKNLSFGYGTRTLLDSFSMLFQRGTALGLLGANGIGKSRLEAVSSFGEEQPLIVSEGRERRNRRTVTEVSGFVGGHPTVMDGQYAQIVYREYVASGTAISAVNPRVPN